MSTSMAALTGTRQLKRLEARKLAMARAQLKKVEVDPELATWRAAIGQAIDIAISQASKTQKECWVALGHNDGARLSRWIATVIRCVDFDWLASSAVGDCLRAARGGD
jgi:hypothetical protein